VQLAGDTSRHFVESRTVQTPVVIRISADVDSLRLTTEGNMAIRVQFTDSATTAERALTPWGRRLLFLRVNGDFRLMGEVLPAEPTRIELLGAVGSVSKRQQLAKQ
jgi:hypothetical protein